MKIMKEPVVRLLFASLLAVLILSISRCYITQSKSTGPSMDHNQNQINPNDYRRWEMSKEPEEPEEYENNNE